jgi:hypothetical protein
MPAHTHTFAGSALAVHTHTDSGHVHPGGVSIYNNPAAAGGASAAGGVSNTGTGFANISSVSAGTPSGTNSTVAAVTWTPKYLNMIICNKT